jgi:hypothetical protein
LVECCPRLVDSLIDRARDVAVILED